MPKAATDTLENLKFEEAIARLEEIVQRMESERVPLDELLENYETGTRLLKVCKGRLDSARVKIRTISAKIKDHEEESTDDESTDDESSDEEIQLL